MFGFPMQVGTVRLGALNLYRDQPGALSAQHADALVMAGVAARAMLSRQAHARQGALVAELEAGSDFRFVVHQVLGRNFRLTWRPPVTTRWSCSDPRRCGRC
jgi:hypothetical protein